jgi:hypothetical protein
MKKIFCTVMFALAMSASVSAENAANSVAGTAADKAVANKYVPTEGIHKFLDFNMDIFQGCQKF